VNALDVYHRLPYTGRCLAASLRGLQLRWWRYDATTPRQVEEAVARESWSAEAWRRWRDDALAALLRRAAARVPYYRELWRGRGGDPGDLGSWPVLTKEQVRRDPLAFLADDRPGRMFPEHTSGSTGTPLRLWWSRRASVAWYALQEARVRGWNGVARGESWAILGGQLVAPAARRRPPFWVWNAALRQLYLSSYHLEPRHAAAYLEALERHRVRYLVGYPSAMAALAALAAEQGLEAPPLAVAIANAEPLYERQRALIAGVFRCPVRDTYGTAELVAGASECGAGRLHLWPEVGVTEILADDEDVRAADGEPGRLIATGLLNADMPLVRYEVGDRAALAPADASCPCGRTLPLVASLEGRLDDVVVTPEGRRVGRLDPVFKADLPIREAQIVQTSPERVALRVVPAPGYGPAVAADLARRLGARLGPSMEVAVEEVERLPRGGAGKLRGVVSEIGRRVLS